MTDKPFWLIFIYANLMPCLDSISGIKSLTWWMALSSISHMPDTTDGENGVTGMNTYIFTLWLRGKDSVSIDARVFAISQRKAAECLWADGVEKVWVIGDCRYSCAGIAE
jgi:hypothetical protein